MPYLRTKPEDSPQSAFDRSSQEKTKQSPERKSKDSAKDAQENGG
jgi:hypothetical protein